MNYPSKESLYFEKDAHWNEAGVKLVTGVIAKQLLPQLKKKK